MTREARARYGLDESLFTLRGTLLLADVEAARGVAEAMNERRDARRFPELAVKAGELFAAGLVHELQHLLVAAWPAPEGGSVMAAGLRRARELSSGSTVEQVLASFATAFPTVAVERRGLTVESYLQGETDGVPNAEVVAEELLLLWLANRNPALERYRELFDESSLTEHDAYESVVAHLGEVSLSEGTGGDGVRTLLATLRGPAEAHPTSLEGQLSYIRREWRPLLGEKLDLLLDRMLFGLDLLAEERKTGNVGPPGPAPVPTADDLRGDVEPAEAERFSPDASWMPRVVLLAKSTYVWLDQLSRRHGREIATLDAIPDQELDELAQRGFNALWLIGLWERSEASRRIKHLRGQPDAVASAYALHDYSIAADLGGEAAYRDLRDRAWHRGIRLASDMVPNHVGIDGRWVIEHPDWFVQLDHPPYPGYRFSGPDLSADDRVGIFLEDHYWDNSDAAVVFKRVERSSGEERFIYHGNDGTTMPWNDTAQLDYLNPAVREAVIQTIVDVARRFPIIRFDAAMTLAKQHVRRLWYPEPGGGGAIPSRAQYGSMSSADFERAMPEEFWREVVDRVAREAPDTLLLAEAFWMMEGYFVRTLGMHRVYNSAFMNMLAREANSEFRALVRNVLEFDPEVLKRFVNFMNNPDEDTAVQQFGRDDKYFGVCTLMCTMPGLPMFGHGQVEGFEEKYGMEYRRARREELPDPWLVERHQRDIFPLLHRRAQFAEVDEFLLYDFVTDDGAVDENVIAYSNRVAGEASLVVYHNSYAETRGRLLGSVPYSSRRGEGRERLQRSLYQGLGLDGGHGRYLVYRDHGSGLEHLVASDEVRERGLEFALGAFRYRVLMDFREVTDSAEEPYAELCRELSGRGVPSVLDAARDLRLRPLFDALGDLLDTPARDGAEALAAYRDFLDALDDFGLEWSVPRKRVEERFALLLDAYDAHASASASLREAMTLHETALLAWMAMEPLDRGVFERYRLEQELAAGQHSPEEPYDSELYAEALPLLLDHAPVAGSSADELLSRLLDDRRFLDCLRLNTYEDERYFDRESFRIVACGVTLAGSLLQYLELGLAEGLADRLSRLREIEEQSGYRLARLRRLIAGPAGAR